MKQPESREEAVFEAALQLGQTERAAYLDKTCAGDPELRRRVEALLGALERAGGLLREPVVARPSEGGEAAPATTALCPPPTDEGPGTVIGRYKLLEKVGEGGFGVVYVAEQREPVKRRVALKIIKLGMDTKQVVARFEAERQALALMDHPNIAKVLDAGATDAGRPFFVMELVRGVKITDYCDQNCLSTCERLGLFRQVCQAIQHAHQKGIIHRDIKPSNILVGSRDGVPVPKVIDFGIAKATQGELTDKTVYTQFQQFIGTPAYMSPEQAEMSVLDIDTRTDIYSLGVLLYELLTGRTPFDQKQLLDAGLDGMRRMIRELEPARPSTRISSLQGEERTTTAKRHGSDAPRLIHLLRGDLDWIAMKCLEKDRARRYETANGLAMDLERHLCNEAVLARPPGQLYRLNKWVRRHKLGFAAGAAVGAALVGGIVVSTWQAVRATGAERAQSRTSQQAEAINRFLTEGLLFQATPEQVAREKKVTMEEVLDIFARELDQDAEVARQPELEATLRLDIGRTYFKLGLWSQAERNLQRAVALRRSVLGQRDPATLAAQEPLAWLLVDSLKRLDEGEVLSRETWQARREVLGPENPDTVDSGNTYACALMGQRKFAEAEPLLRQCVRVHERLHGTNHNSTLAALGDLGLVLQQRGDLVGAEGVYRDVIERRNRSGLADKPESFATLNNLALTLLRQGRVEESEKLLVETRQRSRKLFGPEHPYTLHLQHVLARVLAQAGRLDEAEKLARDTLEVRRLTTPASEATGRLLLVLGQVLAQKERPDEAEPLLQEAQALFREHYAVKPELAAMAANWLGAIQSARHAYPEAEALLLSNSDSFFSPEAEMSPQERGLAVGHIVKHYENWGKPSEAAKWKAKLNALAQTQLNSKVQ